MPLSNNAPTFWNQIADKMTKNHSNWVKEVSLLFMIYNHNRKFGAKPPLDLSKTSI